MLPELRSMRGYRLHARWTGQRRRRLSNVSLCAARRPEFGPPTAAILQKVIYWWAAGQVHPLPSLGGLLGPETRFQMRPILERIIAPALLALALVPAASAANRFKVLHSFGGPNDGNGPSGPPLLDDKGNLYGVTAGGPGMYGYGVTFKLMPQADGKWREAILYTFASEDG